MELDNPIEIGQMYRHTQENEDYDGYCFEIVDIWVSEDKETQVRINSAYEGRERTLHISDITERLENGNIELVSG